MRQTKRKEKGKRKLRVFVEEKMHIYTHIYTQVYTQTHAHLHITNGDYD